MYITRMILSDFGKFHNKEMSLQPGLNLIYGANEAGKSTIKDFLTGMLYGIDKSRGLGARMDLYTMRKPYDRPGFSGILEVYSGGRPYQIARNFLKSEKKTTVTDMQSGGQLTLSSPHHLEGTFLQVEKSCYINTLCIDGSGAKTEQALNDLLQNKLINMSTSHSMQVDKAQAVETLKKLLKDKKRQYAAQNIEGDLQRLAGELYGEDDTEEQLEEIAKRYGQLQDKIEGIQQTEKSVQGASGQLYEIAPQKKTEKRSVIFAVTAFLMAVLCGAIYLLPVSVEVKWVLWLGSLFGVGYMAASAFAQKGRFLNSQKKKRRRRQDDYETQDAMDRVRIQEYMEQLAELKLREETLLALRREKEVKWEQYDGLKAQAAAMQQEKKAVTLAINTIEQLSNAIYNGFGTSLSRRVSDIMEQITDGRYKQVFVGENLDIQVLDGDRYVPLAYLSTGTKEQLYFSLRMAAAKFLDAPAMPLLLDDVFITYDEDRLRRTLEYLADYKDNQIILLTANQKIADYFDEIGRDYNYLELA